jgi:hypothetical protein
LICNKHKFSPVPTYLVFCILRESSQAYTRCSGPDISQNQRLTNTYHYTEYTALLLLIRILILILCFCVSNSRSFYTRTLYLVGNCTETTYNLGGLRDCATICCIKVAAGYIAQLSGLKNPALFYSKKLFLDCPLLGYDLPDLFPNSIFREVREIVQHSTASRLQLKMLHNIRPTTTIAKSTLFYSKKLFLACLCQEMISRPSYKPGGPGYTICIE